MKNLAEQIKDTKKHNIISGYAQLLEGKKRKDFIVEISNYNLLVAARATVNCAKDEELVTFLVEKAQKAGENEKAQKKVNVEAILSLLVFRKYVMATDLIFIEKKNNEDFKNENLAELKELENESVNADVMSFFIGLSPTYEVALQFYKALTILGVQADIDCLSNLISKSPNYQIALQWYEHIQKENLTPSINTYNNLIYKSTNYQIALKWHEKIIKENLTPVIQIYNNLIAKCPTYETALQWYKQAQKENLSPNIEVYHNMICAVSFLKRRFNFEMQFYFWLNFVLDCQILMFFLVYY